METEAVGSERQGMESMVEPSRSVQQQQVFTGSGAARVDGGGVCHAGGWPRTGGTTGGDHPMVQTPRPSFRDILAKARAGVALGVEETEEEDEVECNEGDINFVAGKYGMTVRLSEAFKERLEKRWDFVVVVKLLGRTIGYRTLCSRLQTLWQPSKPMKVVDLENDFFLVGLQCEEDFYQALTDFPRSWYDSEVLKALGSLVGGAMKVDANTKVAIWGKYARVAVEVDLEKL
ncbi:hypothetical protein Tsubulata_007706 [Turnera subulata]|uniref:DUF4283 domain-containing protein n=1 Tax=Turnera subulata TaxID=218843 RepID=A0A9Q0G9I7_9ROSI|nr:hypothetical protein Tsubulata_007706 [Turnera subulata]